MKSVVIFFVPIGAAQADFEAALREHLGLIEKAEAKVCGRTHPPERTDIDETQLWTWFLPNPLPQFS